MRLNPSIFVYGTLRAQSNHPKAKLLRREARALGPARVAGRLYDLGAYPGMLPALDDGDQVAGDLFEMKDAPALLKILDEYENVASGNRRLFIRRLTEVRLPGGELQKAWVYWYTGEVDEKQRIESGDYFGRKRKSRD